jgi:MSHA biogenesis protein MshM
MYERYWHFDRPAFESDFDAEFYFPARSHQGALLKLRFALEHRKGIALLVGDHGAGKSYLTHVLEKELDGPQRPFLRLVFPQLSPADMLSYLATRLGACPGPGVQRGSQDQTLRSLESRLEWMASESQRKVIVLDDAHLLQPQHFETLQLLMSLQQHAGNVLSLVLVGRPELLSRVERASGLDQRVAVRMGVDPLSPEETGQYIEHRMRIAGSTQSMFHDDAYRAFWEISQGVPRRLNQICDLSLLVGYADGMHELTSVEVEAAAEEVLAVSLD